MRRSAPFFAVISDMDGVLTRTARLHARAWTRTFDEYLAQREGPGAPAFSAADYRRYVDGKPREAGVRDFLAARGIVLPEGEPTDAPSQETVHGLGNRKDATFLALLEREGVEVDEEAVAALVRWRRGGLPVAIVSASRNCRRVLAAADLGRHADVIVDGEVARELGLRGKGDILLEASRRLGVAPADAVVLEDATAGVGAAREGGFGLVIGVGDDTRERELLEAGAHRVTQRVDLARFPRELPSALQCRHALAAWQGDRPLAIFLDYDGTLTPIVDDPRAAWISRPMRTIVEALAARVPLAIISGRDRDDVAARVGIEGLVYAGDHGYDIAGGGHVKTLPQAEAALGAVARAERELRQRLGRYPGVLIERKRFSVAVHYRRVDAVSVVEEVFRTVAAVRAKTGLHKRTGKMVLELVPPAEWDKGHALAWIMDVMGVDTARHFVVYIGDDETDEDAFAMLGGAGVGVRVGERVSDSLADFRLDSPMQVQVLLRWWLSRAAGAQAAVETTSPGDGEAATSTPAHGAWRSR